MFCNRICLGVSQASCGAFLDRSNQVRDVDSEIEAGPVVIDPLYVMSGFGVGVLVGMTGVGGGSLMTPLLILLFGIHPTTAVGTDLLFAASTKIVGTAVHASARTIDWALVALLAARARR